MGMFDWFLKARPDRRPSQDPGSGSRMGVGQKAAVEYRTVVLAEEAMCHPIVFRCLHKIATSVRSVKWYAAQDETQVASKRAPASKINELNSVLNSPNDHMTPDQFRYWMALNYAVFGRVPFKVGKGLQGVVNGLYPLYAGNVNVKLNERSILQSYVFGQGEGAITLPAKMRAGTEDAFAYEIYTPNLQGLLDAGRAVSPLNALGLPTSVTKLLLARAFDTASGHPNIKYIVTAEKTLTVKQKESIQELIDNATPGDIESGKSLFLYGVKIEVHELDNNLSDIHTKIPMDDMARMIAGAFGIPIPIFGIGAADAAKFTGNYSEARRSFWEDTLIPEYLEPIAIGMTDALCPEGAVIKFDLDSVAALRDARILKLKELSTVNILTLKEKRDLAGYEDLKAGEVLHEPRPAASNRNTQPTDPEQ